MASIAPVLRTARDAARLFEWRFMDCDREKLLVAHLGPDRRLLWLFEEPVGEVGHVAIPVRAIIADAMRLDSCGLVLAHCHPSGDAEPSDADIAATRKLSEMGAELGLSLYDHLIFAGGECRSLRALGLL
jgi:DNA repair protein RadC